MTPDEERRLREVIVRRAEQFHERLNPFRGGEANNHAWLQAYGLAESGVVLLGEHDAAAEWTELVRQLYLGRFLSCLGRQGENNEGISYWGYGLGFIIGYADMMRAACEIDLYQHPWLRQTARFPMYCARGQAVSFAGGQAEPCSPQASQTRGPRAGLRTAIRTRCGAGDAAVSGLAAADRPAPQCYRRRRVITSTSLVDGCRAAVALQRYRRTQHPTKTAL